MALTVLGTLIQPGIELAETGINVKSFNVRYFPEIDRPTKNFQDQTTGGVVATLASREVDVDAEVLTSSAAGLMLATFIASSTSLVSNDIADFGSPAGILMLKDVTVKQDSGSNRMAAFKLRSDPLFTAV